MHGFLLAFTLSTSLLAPTSAIARLWELVSGLSQPPAAATALEKEGPGWDPNGAMAAPVQPSEEGPGWDPSGHS